MNPLIGGTVRRRSRLRGVVKAALVVVVLAAAGVVAVVGVDFGRAVGRGFDSATVATNGLPPQPTVPPGEGGSQAPAIALEGRQAMSIRLDKQPRAALLFDVERGRALWHREARRPLPIASLTKVMTALLVAERTSSRERVKVTAAALRYSGSGVGVLPRGKRVPVDALLHGMLLVSGNDAAIALADHISGSERRFVALMNRRARQLGLRCTHFSSAYGLEAGDRSCAADLAALSRLVLERKRVARVVRKRQAAVRFPIAGGKLYLNTTNPLLRLRYPGTIGLKTGYTKRAGRTYIGVVRRRGRTLGLVLLGSPDPSVQAKQIFDRAFGRRGGGGARERSARDRAQRRRHSRAERRGARRERVRSAG